MLLLLLLVFQLSGDGHFSRNHSRSYCLNVLTLLLYFVPGVVTDVVMHIIITTIIIIIIIIYLFIYLFVILLVLSPW